MSRIRRNLPAFRGKMHVPTKIIRRRKFDGVLMSDIFMMVASLVFLLFLLFDQLFRKA